jgi:hypothetical protein
MNSKEKGRSRLTEMKQEHLVSDQTFFRFSCDISR